MEPRPKFRNILVKTMMLFFFLGESILSSAHVTVLVTDANDNVPIFDNKNYEFTVKEDAGAGEAIGKIGLFIKDKG